MNFVVYDDAGRILRSGSCMEMDFEAQAGPDEFIIEASGSDESDYVASGNVVSRPLLPVEVSGKTIIVPSGTVFTVLSPRMSGIATDGVLEFEFSEPGKYTVHLSNWPYRETEVILEN
jgi:hypothetical protein